MPRLPTASSDPILTIQGVHTTFGQWPVSKTEGEAVLAAFTNWLQSPTQAHKLFAFSTRKPEGPPREPELVVVDLSAVTIARMTQPNQATVGQAETAPRRRRTGGVSKPAK